jgi:hypothetical protein
MVVFIVLGFEPVPTGVYVCNNVTYLKAIKILRIKKDAGGSQILPLHHAAGS